jgi:hypothetical protein
LKPERFKDVNLVFLVLAVTRCEFWRAGELGVPGIESEVRGPLQIQPPPHPIYLYS